MMKSLNSILKTGVLACLMLVMLPSIGLTANILVYSTTKTLGPLCYPKDWYDDDLPSILAECGHSTTVTDRLTDPEITNALLLDYDQLWLMSSDTAFEGCFWPSEIEEIQGFVRGGHGLLIMADHTYPEGGHYYASDANQIAGPNGVHFFGLTDHTPGGGATEPVVPETSSHPLFAGVEEITGNRSEALMSVTGSVDVIATYGGDDLIAVASTGGGRIVFDVTCQRFWDTEIFIGADNPRYAQNIANWLQGSSASVPSVSTAGLVSIAIVLLIAGTMGLGLRNRRRCSPDARTAESGIGC